jgi:hypothetical protein
MTTFKAKMNPNSINIEIKEMGNENTRRMKMAQDRVQWRILIQEFSFIIFVLLAAVNIMMMMIMGIEMVPETSAICNKLTGV